VLHPELKKKNNQKQKPKQPSKVNVVKSDGNDSDSSSFSFSITPSIYYSDTSEWMLDSGATYHVYPRRE